MPQANSDKHAPGAKRAVLIWVVVLALLAAAGVGIKYGRYHFIAKQFAVVEPGALYRSGYCEPGPLTRIIREHDIRTILALLNDAPNAEDQQKEEAVAQREGVKLLRIGMPGNGCADFALIDQAAEIIADETHRPLLVHCAAGVNRTGIAYAAWRIRFCGWDDEQALAEAIERGYSPWRNPEMRDHLRRYYEWCAARSQPASRPLETAAPSSG